MEQHQGLNQEKTMLIWALRKGRVGSAVEGAGEVCWPKQREQRRDLSSQGRGGGNGHGVCRREGPLG